MQQGSQNMEHCLPCSDSCSLTVKLVQYLVGFLCSVYFKLPPNFGDCGIEKV